MQLKIVKSENQHGHVQYMIKRKFLWCWLPAKVLVHYHTTCQVNDPGLFAVALLTKRTMIFNSLPLAQKVLEHLENPYHEKYKGNKIIAVLNDLTLDRVFINKSFFDITYKDLGYEFSEDIFVLRKMIDDREWSKFSEFK